MPITLRVLSGARAGQADSFEKPVIMIGRNPTSDLRFDPEQDRDVSKDHGVIRLVDGRWMLRDSRSTNGTWVNGARIDGDHELRQGDVIAFGRRGPQVTVDFDRTGSMATPGGGHTTPRRQEAPIASTNPASSGGAGSARPSPPGGGGVAAPPAPPAPPVTAATPSAAVPPRPARNTDMRIQAAVSEHTRQVKRIAIAAVALVALIAGGAWWVEHQRAARADAQVAALLGELQSLQQSLAAQARQSSGRIAALDSAYASSQRTIADLTERFRARPSGANLQSLSQQITEARQQQQSLATASPESFEAINSANAGAVAILYVEMPGGALFSGTAFVVSPSGLLVTNKHLVLDSSGREPSRLAIKFNGDADTRRARLVRVVEGSDLALLQMDGPGPYKAVKGVTPSARALRVGAAVATIGFPHGTSLAMEGKKATATFDIGTVSKVLSDRLQLTTYAAEGASGSPIFDREGYVVGVIYGGPEGAKGRIVYAIPSEQLIEALPEEARGAVR